jgi:hypothetical protein
MTTPTPPSPNPPEDESQSVVPDEILAPTNKFLPAQQQQSDSFYLVYKALELKITSGDPQALNQVIQLYSEQRAERSALQRQALELQQQELALREKQLDYQQDLTLKTKTATKNNVRLIIMALMIAFLSSLGYATLTKDSSLADRVFTGALGLIGGGGGAVLLRQDSKENDRN